MTSEVSNFIPGSLEDMDKYIEAADGHHVTAKQKGQERIKMCDYHGDPLIAMLHNVLLAPDLCDRLTFDSEDVVSILSISVQYVVMSLHYPILLRSTPCKIIYEKGTYILHSLA